MDSKDNVAKYCTVLLVGTLTLTCMYSLLYSTKGGCKCGRNHREYFENVALSDLELQIMLYFNNTSTPTVSNYADIVKNHEVYRKLSSYIYFASKTPVTAEHFAKFRL